MRSWPIRALAVLATLALAPPAAADLAQEQELAARFAPVVRLVEQPEECGPGEPYDPIDVDALFDEPTVALRGPWGGADLVRIAPASTQLAPGLYEYHLDFPGDALSPGCTYEQWSRRISAGREPTVYAHVVTDPGYPGQLALQYWLFYAFNDWNNLHEGDWEMIQLIFDADSAGEALTALPREVGYSQHEGAERSDWEGGSLEVVDGTHPVVYPAAGSHANFFGSALHLGANGQQGVGCDDTTGPSRELRPDVQTIPSDPAAAQAAFPWIAFEGRWGELQPAFYNGPTGPNLKRQWTQPIAWTDGWRDFSYAVPAGGALGTNATDFCCRAIEGGSRALGRAIDDPGWALVVVGVLLAILVWLLTRARWRPSAPLRIARRRAWGQVVAATWRAYARWPVLFVGIGAVLIPLSLLMALLQGLLLHLSSVVGVDTEAESKGFLVLLVLTIATTLTLLALGLVQAATAQAMVALEEDRRIGPVEAYRLALRHLRPLVGALLLAVLVVLLLIGTVVLIPVAVWLTVRWALIVPVIQLEGATALGALHRSGRLVRLGWVKVASLIVAGAAAALVLGPAIGFVLIVFTDTPLYVVNVVAGVVYALALPLVAITTMYVYADARVRDALEEQAGGEVLPPELALAGPGAGR
jgi:hypothetical protein